MTWNGLERFRDLGLLVLRVGVGGAYVWIHGWPKISAGPEGWARYGEAVSHLGIEFGYVFWGFAAAFAEFVGGMLVMLGLFFRPACLLLFITMGVAANRHLAMGDGLRGSAHALKMAFVFLGLLTVGPGRYSLDAWIARRRKRVSGYEEEAYASEH